MPDILEFSGVMRGGKVHIAASKQRARWKDGTPLTITVEKKRATRSLDQNAWYWGVILKLLSEHTGYTVDEMHEYCRERFNPKRLIVQNAVGEVIDERRIGQTTTKLNKITFGEYCEQIREWAAADLGVVIPDPDPNWREPVPEPNDFAPEEQ